MSPFEEIVLVLTLVFTLAVIFYLWPRWCMSCKKWVSPFRWFSLTRNPDMHEECARKAKEWNPAL